MNQYSCAVHSKNFQTTILWHKKVSQTIEQLAFSNQNMNKTAQSNKDGQAELAMSHWVIQKWESGRIYEMGKNKNSQQTSHIFCN